MPTKNKIGVIDLFCGIGGLSHGMYKEGLDIIAGFDIDDTCKYAYEKNNKSTFYNQDIKTVTKETKYNPYKEMILIYQITLLQKGQDLEGTAEKIEKTFTSRHWLGLGEHKKLSPQDVYKIVEMSY